jgi:hypothetical protein
VRYAGKSSSRIALGDSTAEFKSLDGLGRMKGLLKASWNDHHF